MTHERLLTALFARFGVSISEAEAAVHRDTEPRNAILLLLANREIAARFDTAHGRPPNEDDIDELLDIYNALTARNTG